MEGNPLGCHREPDGVRLSMLGPLTIERGGAALELPASRKMCGLLAYLALTQRPVRRSRLCELLWDEAANDPRGELRWCLSKLRGPLGDAAGNVVVTSGDTIALRLDGWFVDAAEVASAMNGAIETLGSQQLQALCELYSGELLEGLVIERCPEFNLWLTGQRSRYAAFRTTLLQRLVESLPADSGKRLAALEKWAEVAPFDDRAQIGLLRRLAAWLRRREHRPESHDQNRRLAVYARAPDARRTARPRAHLRARGRPGARLPAHARVGARRAAKRLWRRSRRNPRQF